WRTGDFLMKGWLLASLVGGAVVTACVLPDVEIDPELGELPDTEIGSSQGQGGSGIMVPPASGGSGGAAGTGNELNPDDVELPGAGGAAVGGVNQGEAMGGSSGAAGTAGTGGPAGSSGAGGTGTGGTGAGGTGPGVANPPSTDAVIEECSQSLDRETACINYCQQYIEACGDFEEANTYGGVADCTSTCIASLWAVGDTTTGSNSICCRWLHATLAAQLLTSQFPHCFHAAEVPSEGQSGGCAPGAGTSAAP
ncbi:MAG: hypothetical protein ABW217_06445, partial [Polyangiaceae bacterium]